MPVAIGQHPSSDNWKLGYVVLRSIHDPDVLQAMLDLTNGDIGLWVMSNSFEDGFVCVSFVAHYEILWITCTITL